LNQSCESFRSFAGALNAGGAPPSVSGDGVLGGGSEFLAADGCTVLGCRVSFGLCGPRAATKHDTACENGADSTLVEVLRHLLLGTVDDNVGCSRLARNEGGCVPVEGLGRWRNFNNWKRGSQEIE